MVEIYLGAYCAYDTSEYTDKPAETNYANYDIYVAYDSITKLLNGDTCTINNIRIKAYSVSGFKGQEGYSNSVYVGNFTVGGTSVINPNPINEYSYSWPCSYYDGGVLQPTASFESLGYSIELPISPDAESVDVQVSLYVNKTKLYPNTLSKSLNIEIIDPTETGMSNVRLATNEFKHGKTWLRLPDGSWVKATDVFKRDLTNIWRESI